MSYICKQQGDYKWWMDKDVKGSFLMYTEGGEKKHTQQTNKQTNKQLYVSGCICKAQVLTIKLQQFSILELYFF